jgi:hypothetical protein
MTTTRYIPKDSKAIEHPLGVVYTYEDQKGRPIAIGYAGKSNKSAFHNSFIGKDPEQMRQDKVDEFFQGLVQHAQAVQKRAEERKQPHSLKVGQIISNSWGYDQTNVDFYQIVKTSAKFVWLRKLAQTTTEEGFMCGKTQPIPGHFNSDEVTQHGVSVWDLGQSVNFEYGCGSVYDGNPKRCSWYA